MMQEDLNLELRCPYITERCPEMIKLKNSSRRGIVDENLADKYYEVCLGGRECSTRDFLEDKG